jgi:hypothetical protein
MQRGFNFLSGYTINLTLSLRMAAINNLFYQFVHRLKISLTFSATFLQM